MKLENGALKADGSAYSAEEIKEQNDFIDLVAKINREQNANMISKEDAQKMVEDAIEAIEATNVELKAQADKLYKAQVKQGLEMQQKMNVGAVKTMRQSLTEAFETVKDQIDAIVKNGGKQSAPLVIKSAITMQSDNTIGAGATHFNLTQSTGVISTLRKRILTYLANVSPLNLDPTRPYANWIEETDEQGTPIFIGEGDTKTQVSVKYEEKEKKAKKIAVHGKVSTEMMRYLPNLIAYIENNMMKRVDIATEDQLFNGNDTGDNLAGLIPYATTFDGGVGVKAGAGLVGLVDKPTYADVIRAAVLQVQNSYGQATGFYVDNDILALMDTEKDDFGGYVLPPFKSVDGTTVAGVKLIPTTALAGTSFEFVGGDLSAINVGFTDAMNIQIGLDGNDFTKNLKTIIVEQELVQFVSANDTQVLVKGTFAAAKTLIEAVALP